MPVFLAAQGMPEAAETCVRAAAGARLDVWPTLGRPCPPSPPRASIPTPNTRPPPRSPTPPPPLLLLLLLPLLVQPWDECRRILLELLEEPCVAELFSSPVGEDVAPGYHAMIRQPMDIGTIQRARGVQACRPEQRHLVGVPGSREGAAPYGAGNKSLPVSLPMPTSGGAGAEQGHLAGASTPPTPASIAACGLP